MALRAEPVDFLRNAHSATRYPGLQALHNSAERDGCLRSWMAFLRHPGGGGLGGLCTTQWTTTLGGGDADLSINEIRRGERSRSPPIRFIAHPPRGPALQLSPGDSPAPSRQAAPCEQYLLGGPHQRAETSLHGWLVGILQAADTTLVGLSDGGGEVGQIASLEG